MEGMKPNWFIAWPVQPGPWFEPLVRDAPAALRRFHPEDLHITLAFLGPVSSDAALAAWRVVATAAMAPLHGVLGGLAGFGNPRAPSAFSLEVEGDALREAIGVWRGPVATAAGVRPDDRPPRAHCTVARPRREAGHAERRAGLEWARSKTPLGIPIVLDRLALYTWSADRRARQFAIVMERRL